MRFKDHCKSKEQSGSIVAAANKFCLQAPSKDGQLHLTVSLKHFRIFGGERG